jgi:hypothetical protein
LRRALRRRSERQVLGLRNETKEKMVSIRRPEIADPNSTDSSLYNHIRSTAFYLDAAPVLSDLGLPFRAGLDDIISLVPLYGDLLSGVFQLYQVFLCWLFGVPAYLLSQMVSASTSRAARAVGRGKWARE